MKYLFSIAFVLKLSVCVVACGFHLSHPIIQIIEGALKILIGNKMPKYEREILRSMFVY